MGLRAKGLTSWLIPGLIVFLTIGAFLPALQNGFVNWDDDKNLLQNPNYRGLGWMQLSWMFTTFYMGHYQPLSWMTFGLDYLLWGMDPFGYHLTSLLLHAANALLFYFVALRLLALGFSVPATPKDLSLQVAAGFAALVFAIHPLRVESVAWATERRDVLSSLFFLWTILCYLRAVAVRTAERTRMRWMTGALIVYTLSLLSKASGITLPIVLLVLDVYPLRRLGGGARKWFGPEAQRVWWEKVPFLLLAVIFGIVALLAQKEAGAFKGLEQYGLLARFAQALFGIAFYLWKSVMPLKLSPVYELPLHLTLWHWSFLLSGASVIVASVCLFMARRQWPAGLAIWVCYIAILAPVLGIAQSGVQFVADRYSYLSCMGWAVLAGGGLLRIWNLWSRGAVGRRIFILSGGLAGLVVIALGVLTWKQVQVWHDSERLWRYAVAVSPESSSAHNNLANVLVRQGKNLEEAIAHYRKALEINPAYAKAHYNLGQVLAMRGQIKEAAQHYGQALEINPTIAEAHNDLGKILAAQGMLEEAIAHYRQALELKSVATVQSESHFNLGTALAKQGHLEEAMEHLEQALRIMPDFAEAHHYLGLILAAQGQLDKAIGYFREALRIQPEFAEAHESLGRALAQQGKKAEAIQHYQEALRILRLRGEEKSPR